MTTPAATSPFAYPKRCKDNRSLSVSASRPPMVYGGTRCRFMDFTEQAARFANASGIGAFLPFGDAGDVAGMARFDPERPFQS
jgi:hypothetical protein